MTPHVDTLNAHRCCEAYFTSCNHHSICLFWPKLLFKHTVGGDLKSPDLVLESPEQTNKLVSLSEACSSSFKDYNYFASFLIQHSHNNLLFVIEVVWRPSALLV